MMQLVEFLRARYDARAESLREDVAAGHMVGAGYYDSAELLADIEAKRRIVDTLASRERADDSDEGVWYMVGYGRARFDVLRLMALPFADHEDYQEEWRV